MKKITIVLTLIITIPTFALDNDSCNKPHFNVKGLGYIAKLSNNGELLWHKLTQEIGGYGSDLYFENGKIVLNLTSSDAFHFQGDYIPPTGDPINPISHYFTFTLDGQFVSSSHPGTVYGYPMGRTANPKLPHKRLFAICVTELIPKRYGFLDVPHNHCYDIALIKDICTKSKTDTSVKPQWMYLLNGLHDDFNFDILLDSLGNYYICGMVSTDFTWPKEPYYYNPNVIDTFPNYYPPVLPVVKDTTKPKDTTIVQPPVINPVYHFAVTVFPNPSDGKFTMKVESESDEMLYLSVADMAGKMLWTEPVRMNVYKGQNSFFLDLSPYSKGSYAITLTNSNQNHKYSGIIEKQE